MIIVEIIFNLSLLIAVSVLSGFVVIRWKRGTREGIVLQGLLFGIVALIGMLNPFVLSPGIFFDGRSVVISLCALFFGPVSGLLATVIALGYRVYMGGGGVVTGVCVIVSSYLIGYAFYVKKQKTKSPVTSPELYLFGLLVHMAMIAFMAAIPSGMRALTYKTLSLTVLGIYPLATLLIGKILKDQEDNAALLAGLAAGERQFRSLVNTMSQGLAVHEVICNEAGIAVDYRFIYVNEKYEQITGFRKEAILGKTVLEVLPRTSARTIKKYGEVALTGKPFHFESFSREKQIYYEADIYQPIDNQFAVILSDITSRKLAEREIISTNKQQEKLIIEKDKLFSIVSHDLQSPMNGIIGLTGMIKDETESFSREHIKEIAASIHTSATSIIQLMHGLLEWSKLQRETIVFTPEPVLLGEIFDKCTSLLHESAKAKQITIRSDIPEPAGVMADRQMLESVMRNLLSNAVKFTPLGGDIQVSVSQADRNTSIISVRDSGIGMSAALQEKLFCMSSKINRKGTAGELSSGLGLILCKDLIGRHGGKIWAESKEGEGSTFYFTLTASVNVPVPG